MQILNNIHIVQYMNFDVVRLNTSILTRISTELCFKSIRVNLCKEYSSLPIDNTEYLYHYPQLNYRSVEECPDEKRIISTTIFGLLHS